MITIKREDGTPIADVDESAHIGDMQNKCYAFFKVPHGKRETYTVYRGQLIVRHTVTFNAGLFRASVPTRRTVVYLYFPKGYADENKCPDLFCVSSGSDVSSIGQAEKLIDRILDGGKYFYGI